MYVDGPVSGYEEELRKVDRAIEITKKAKEVLRGAAEDADEKTLLQEICQAIVRIGGYRMAWIGYLMHDQELTISPMAHAGYENGYFDQIKVTWSEGPETSHGPGGIAARTGKPFICRNIRTEPAFRPWMAEAIKEGYESAVSIPLVAFGKTIGILAIYSDKEGDFDPRSVDLIMELARDVAYGIVSRRNRIERSKTEAQLEDQRTRMEAVLSALPVGVAIVDRQGRIIQANTFFHTIWGGAPMVESVSEYGRYRGWWADTGQEVTPEEWGVARALKGETIIGQTVDITRFDGTRGTILNSAAPIRDRSGHMIGAVAVVQDITYRRKLEYDLKEAKDRSELYLDLVSHDINNLNQAGIGFLELALEMLREEGRITDSQYIEKPLESLRNSSRLIANVRLLQRVSAGDVERRPVDLCEIIRKIVEQHSHTPGRTVNITYRREGSCEVMANDLIKEAVSNIVGNAVKHSDPGRPLSVEITQSMIRDSGKLYCRLDIADNGAGIPDEFKGKLFQRLRRGKTRAGGMGLGLYLARALIGDAGGRIWMEDRVPGDYRKGSRFVILLPVAGEQEKDAAAQAQA